jgi:hypothetical protein
MLVAALCERYGWKRVPGWGGTVVWAELHVLTVLLECLDEGGPSRDGCPKRIK